VLNFHGNRSQNPSLRPRSSPHCYKASRAKLTLHQASGHRATAVWPRIDVSRPPRKSHVIAEDWSTSLTVACHLSFIAASWGPLGEFCAPHRPYRRRSYQEKPTRAATLLSLVRSPMAPPRVGVPPPPAKATPGRPSWHRQLRLEVAVPVRYFKSWTSNPKVAIDIRSTHISSLRKNPIVDGFNDPD
jgi:hypothetical protein